METKGKMKIGEFLVKEGLLSPSHIPVILEHSRTTGMRFGEAAVDLGLLNEDNLIGLFGPQYKKDFFKVSADHFPVGTRDVLSLELILKYGCLPLGQKKIKRFFKPELTLLNIGMADPSDEKCKKISDALGESFQIRFFLILPTDWLHIMKSIYCLSDEQLYEFMSQGKIDSRIAQFL